MLRNIIVLSIAAMIVGFIPVGAQTKLPPPPPGFKTNADSPSITAMRAAGVMDMLEAIKPNDGWPGCIVDPNVKFSASWTSRPGANQNVKMMLEMPEEPPAFSMGTKTEPAGKKAYKGGVLAWKKKTVMAAGMASSKCPGNQVILYDGSWTGYSNGKLLGVGVSNLYGQKEAGQAWIDPYIDKLLATVSNSK
jgi:hypothetical protein